jgi:hypothetical protein
VTAAAALVIAVCLSGPASAQAPLGFSIDPTEGFPGDVVHGMVNTDDIAANCTGLEDPFDLLFTFVDVYYTLLDPDFIQIYYPDFSAGDSPLTTALDPETYPQLGYTHVIFSLFGAIGDFPPGTTADFVASLRALLFADIATQEPQGEVSTFDPTTGLGSVIVPNVDPGLWAVAAACLVGSNDPQDVGDAVDRAAELAQVNGLPLGPLSFADLMDPEFIAYLQENAPQWFQEMVVPEAIGVQLFTVLAPLGHFLCYRAHPAVGVCAGTAESTIPEQLPVTLEDRFFGVYSGTAHRPVDLCAPAVKNDEDPEAPASPDFLTSYKLSVPGPVRLRRGRVMALNQFGVYALDLLQPDWLLVPSAASLTCSLPAPADGFLNDFTCYSLQVRNKDVPKLGSVMVGTAFGTVEVEPGNPRHLCVPASKNGGPVIASSPENLLCYDVKSGVGPGSAPIVSIANQFGLETQRIGQRRELCVPTDLTE